MSDSKPVFTAYCCGLPMKQTETDTHIRFVCATGHHGRWFVMAKSPESVSQCSHENANLLTSDLGALRLYSCPQCGARYTVFADGVKLEAHIEGVSAEEVSKVGRETICRMWDIYHRMGEGRRGSFGSLFKKEVNIVIQKIKGDTVVGAKKTESISVQGNGSIGKAGKNASTEVQKEITQSKKEWVRPIVIAVIGSVLAAIAVYFLKVFGIIIM